MRSVPITSIYWCPNCPNGDIECLDAGEFDTFGIRKGPSHNHIRRTDVGKQCARGYCDTWGNNNLPGCTHIGRKCAFSISSAGWGDRHPGCLDVSLKYPCLDRYTGRVYDNPGCTYPGKQRTFCICGAWGNHRNVGRTCISIGINGLDYCEGCCTE